jgi:hypothetical protein
MSEHCFWNQGAGCDGVGLKLDPPAESVKHLDTRRMQPVMGQFMEGDKQSLDSS